MTEYNLIRVPLGYYTVFPKPTHSQLSEYYANKYFQTNRGEYQKKYSGIELDYFDAEVELAIETIERFSNLTRRNMLDLGCGEGFFAGNLKSRGWEVVAVDYSEDGIRSHNPQILPDFIQGDLHDYLESEVNLISDFDFVNLDNVLEHVPDPINLLQQIRKRMSSDAILRIEVPNDFSNFQELIVQMGCSEETWVAPPEHLNYFNQASLRSILESAGFKLLSIQADFPIELFLINENSNYWKNPELGKAAHESRVIITNYLAKKNISRLVDYQEAAAELEFGRQLTAYVSLAS